MPLLLGIGLISKVSAVIDSTAQSSLNAARNAASGDALIANDGAVIATTTYREWLAR